MNIAQASGRLLGKVTRESFSEASKRNYGGKMAQLLRPKLFFGSFKCLFLDKIALDRELFHSYLNNFFISIPN